MIYLFDTTAVSGWMRDDPVLLTRMNQLAATDRMVICSVVRGEFLFGILRLPPGERRDRLSARAISAFNTFGCAPVPEGAGDQYARIKLEQQHKGLSLDKNDLWILATALSLDATLISHDRDFERVNDIRVEDWSR